jgi:hypothetical protein
VTYDRFFDEIIVHDKTSLDITWLKDKSLADLENLPDPMYWRATSSRIWNPQ